MSGSMACWRRRDVVQAVKAVEIGAA